MRQLTFSGFTKQYVSALSGTGTTALYPLMREAGSTNPRLREPVFLYAASNDLMPVLLTASKRTPFYEEYLQLSQRFDHDTLLEALSSHSPLLSEAYHKVWRSYLSVMQKPTRDNRVKELMRQKILALQAKTGMTTYRLCKSLDLNNANINAWLKHGIPGKISLENARRILNYMESGFAKDAIPPTV